MSTKTYKLLCRLKIQLTFNRHVLVAFEIFVLTNSDFHGKISVLHKKISLDRFKVGKVNAVLGGSFTSPICSVSLLDALCTPFCVEARLPADMPRRSTPLFCTSYKASAQQ